MKTKITKNRITALILALLLVLTVLSPTLPVKAQETTTDGAGTTQNNIGTSAGAGDNLPTDTTDGNDSDAPTITTNPDGTRTLKLSQSVYLIDDDGKSSFSYEDTFTVVGAGKFVIVGYYHSTEPEDHADFQSYLLSDEPFKGEWTRRSSNNGNVSSDTYELLSSSYKGVNYTGLSGAYSSVLNKNCYTHGFMNEHKTDYKNFVDALKADIDNGRIDLDKDDFVSEDDKINMTPVRDPSIGYLPRARYFDDRKKHSTLRETTATIQWDSFQEPYVSDLDNYYYVEIYANLHYRLATESSFRDVMYRLKKYGELKYVAERDVFSYSAPFDAHKATLDLEFENAKVLFPQSYVSAYYVRLVHYDYEKQQVLCGGWTKLVPNGDGGCTSSTGDFPNDTPSGDDDFVPDDDDPKEWGDDGWESGFDPDDPVNPYDPDFGIDTSSIGAFIVSAITSFLNAFKSILSLVGEFPDLCKHVFSFLPEEISTLMFGGVAAIIVMRFLGR